MTKEQIPSSLDERVQLLDDGTTCIWSVAVVDGGAPYEPPLRSTDPDWDLHVPPTQVMLPSSSIGPLWRLPALHPSHASRWGEVRQGPSCFGPQVDKKDADTPDGWVPRDPRILRLTGAHSLFSCSLSSGAPTRGT